MDHYIGLFAAYGVVAAIRYCILRLSPDFIALPLFPVLKRPGTELGLLLLTVVAIILVGQLYTAGNLIPARPFLGRTYGITEPGSDFLSGFRLFLVRQATTRIPVSGIRPITQTHGTRIGVGRSCSWRLYHSFTGGCISVETRGTNVESG